MYVPLGTWFSTTSHNSCQVPPPPPPILLLLKLSSKQVVETAKAIIINTIVSQAIMHANFEPHVNDHVTVSATCALTVPWQCVDFSIIVTFSSPNRKADLFVNVDCNCLIVPPKNWKWMSVQPFQKQKSLKSLHSKTWKAVQFYVPWWHIGFVFYVALASLGIHCF